MNSSDLAKNILFSLAEKNGVSGYEDNLFSSLRPMFEPLLTECNRDFMGNFYAWKKGTGSEQIIMLAAHLDEIGLMVTHINERGFLHFVTVGGIDERTLLYQEVLVHSSRELRGVITYLPSQNQHDEGKQKAIGLSNLIIDIGCTKDEAVKLVTQGDIVSLIRTPYPLQNDKITGKALDDRAGIAVLAVCLNELSRIKHRHNVVAVATVQEEVGLRGATTSARTLGPQLAVVVDVTHGQTLDTKNQVSIQLGKGPAITLGPNIHPGIFRQLTRCAKEARIPYQLQPVAGATGTDARVIQLTGQGVPTGLISIPLRYMHTCVETASLQDIVDGGKLLASFIAALPADLEELTCY